jgi:hypothetical protein
MFSKSGKHFANPAVGRMHDKAGSKPTEVSEKGAKPNAPSMSGDQGHASETHGTEPHPQTGVHAVMITHHGGGHAKTHTHHDGGHIETNDHANLAEAHAYAQQMLPLDEQSEQQPPMGGAPMGDVAPLGNMMGSGS